MADRMGVPPALRVSPLTTLLTSTRTVPELDQLQTLVEVTVNGQVEGMARY